MITIKHKGDLRKTFRFLEHAKEVDIERILHHFGALGVIRLSNATPKESGRTADSWSYDIEKTESSYKIVWSNSNVNKHVNIALILQCGHATRNGGYVVGRDYINPALQSVFDQMADAAWMEITRY